MIRTRGVSAFLFAVTLTWVAFAAPDVPIQVRQPGTQPEDQVTAFATNCDSCHFDGNPDADETFLPEIGWNGSMMSHSMRDGLYWATVAIAEQDFLPGADPTLRGGVGDLCLRCHGPNGWLQSRSTPTDGSAYTGNDQRGVECEFCHLLVDPDATVNVAGTTEEQNPPFEAFDPLSGEGYHGSGQYVINSGGTRLGPYGDAAANHPFLQSGFHRDGDLCGTCHDVSNPAVGDLAPNHGAQQPLDPGTFSGDPEETDEDALAAFNNRPYQYGIVERTFSEWRASALDDWPVGNYAGLPADLQVTGGALEVAHQAALASNPPDGSYLDGTPRYYSCQTCHMPPRTGKGCNKNQAPVRGDLPWHDMTGGGYWAPQVALYQATEGTLRVGTLSADQRAGLLAGVSRAEDQLRMAAALDAEQVGPDLLVRVTNLTGHKLISGYPEGRRLWLNVRWYDSGDFLIAEDGEYGIVRTLDFGGTPYDVRSILDLDDTVIYEARPGMRQDWAAALISLGYPSDLALQYDRLTDLPTLTLGDLAAKPAGTDEHTFHFVINNVLLSDNRVPPLGLAYDEASERNVLPVPATLYGDPGPGGTFEHFDEVPFAIPLGAARAEVRLYYQQTSWEYVQFLWLANDGLGFLGQEGDNLLDAWLNAGTELNPPRPPQSAPFEMALATATIAGASGVPGEASAGDVPSSLMTAAYHDLTASVQITYTPACDATDHTIYYGDLADVATYAYSGAECFVGASGSATFDPGPGSFYFLVVANDSAEEGSYGLDGLGHERPEAMATPGCDYPQNLGGVVCE